MSWTLVAGGNVPQLPAALGQQDESVSLPVALSDENVQSFSDIEDQLALIAVAMQAIAGAKGIAADLRVTVLNPTGTAVTVSSGTVTNLAQIGGVTANSVVQDWENQTYTSTFSANITRP